MRATTDTLNALVEFDRPFTVTGYRFRTAGREGFEIIDGPAGLFAPEVYVGCDDDGQISSVDDAVMMEELRRAGWEVLNGYSGQHGYAGPIMHASEYLGGGLARDVLETPGTYVVCAVETLDDDEEPAGWVILRHVPTTCPLETSYGTGHPTTYCQRDALPGHPSGWCAEHLYEWGRISEARYIAAPASSRYPIGESYGELVDRMTRDPENYPHIIEDGACVECGMTDPEGWACTSHPDWRAEL